MHNRKMIAYVICAIVGTGFAQAAQARAKIASTSNDNICLNAIYQAEQSNRLPSQLLEAISLTESGKWNKKRKRREPWPWTVTSGKNGKYFKTKREAIAQVHKLKAQGIRNIDVGCMQINLHYHPNAFKNLDDAFNPKHNVGYATKLLLKLKKRHGAWTTAVGNYHSATPHLHKKYRNKVLATWRKNRSKAMTIAANKTTYSHNKVVKPRRYAMINVHDKQQSQYNNRPIAQPNTQVMEKRRKWKLYVSSPIEDF